LKYKEEKNRKFEVIGTPIAKGRPRLGRWGTYTPERTANYENLVKISYLNQCNYKFVDKPLKMEIWAYFEPTKTEKKSKKKYASLIGQAYIKKPDLDNIAKSICDALNDVAYEDDSQIVVLIIHKLYAEQAKAVIEISEM
jgi:Holliday junction resolvase RusA-like endonuclease